MADGDIARRDHTLTSLVRITNSQTEEGGDGIGVVLTLGGAFISGKIIPNWLWFAEVERRLRGQENPANGGVAGGLSELFSFFRQELISMREDESKIAQVYEKLPERVQQTLGANDHTEYIHLADARVFHPGQPGMPGNGMLWRGRLKDISGWSLGLLAVTE
jgi:hypothetical protein